MRAQSGQHNPRAFHRVAGQHPLVLPGLWPPEVWHIACEHEPVPLDDVLGVGADGGVAGGVVDAERGGGRGAERVPGGGGQGVQGRGSGGDEDLPGLRPVRGRGLGAGRQRGRLRLRREGEGGGGGHGTCSSCVAGVCRRLFEIDNEVAATADNTVLFRQHG